MKLSEYNKKRNFNKTKEPLGKVRKKSKRLYNLYNNKKLNKTIFNRCCNFKLLEEKCMKYNKELTLV